MQRLDDPRDILFPVKKSPVFAEVSESEKKEIKQKVKIPGKSAIVDTANQRIVGVVGPGYKLMTNKEALEVAQRCCQEVFPETQPSEWKMTFAEAPSTGSYCHIDLVHNTADLDFEYLMTGTRQDVPESFGPFIRVTNSYNGSRALAFSIGFYRKVCRNGLVSPETIIEFKFNHTRKDLKEMIEFTVEREKISEMREKFSSYFNILRDYEIHKRYFRPIIIKSLRLKKPKQMQGTFKSRRAFNRAKAWQDLEKHIDSVALRYIKEQGENAYAVLNSITEVASHSPDNQCIRRDRHSLQVLAGEWLVSFSKECRSPSFSVESYLKKPYEKSEKRPTYRRHRSGEFS